MTPDSQTSSSARALARNAPWRFLAAFLREPLTVGAPWPSSRALARAVVDTCQFAPHATVVELGPGTGAFTELLLERLNSRGRLLAIEISPTNVEVLRRRFPHCQVIHDSAENLVAHLGGRRADCIVSGLAWANMLPGLQDRIFSAICRGLAPSGQFVAFGYAHARWAPTTLRFRRLMFENFARVETSPIIWQNLPPAYVYSCWRPIGPRAAQPRTNHDPDRHRRRSRPQR
ncbi:MAG: methyltransferase domain-containing protein [Verrucomicrobiae bacterium]|nr:methyltransferase domain-containing protein [Verrucomicrobiae bacterium]MDW8308204.1 methyltransferase domain-containing protein [Verrucomicrobiales bacterium]